MTEVLRIDASPVGGRTIDLVFAGDTCLRTPETRTALQRDPAAVFSDDVRALFARADAALVNLECPVAAGGAPIRKAGMHLAGHPEIVAALAALPVKVVSMANNHILDQGAEAMLATRRACEEAGLAGIGVGVDRADAVRARILELGGLRVAFLAFAETEFSAAGPTSPGAAPLDPETAGAAVRESRARADVVVVSVHGGNEHYFAPSPRTQSWYRFLIDCGAHAVIGHHPHAVQGSELYRNGFIAYSLGNFLFDSATPMRPSWYTGLVLELRVGAAGVEAAAFHPTRQVEDERGVRVAWLAGDDLARAGARLERLNATAADPEAVEQLWRCYCTARRGAYDQRLLAGARATRMSARDLFALAVAARAPYYLFLAAAKLLGRLGMSARRDETEQARLLNLFQCPAHREIVTTALRMDWRGEAPAPEWQRTYDALARDDS